MALGILHLLSEFEDVNDRESETAFFRTHVPWIGPQAYLNIIFKPAPEAVLAEAARRVRMPASLIEFLRRQNGAILFSGALSVCGVHRHGQLLNRQEAFSRMPFNIEDENDDWPPDDSERFLALGGYGFDGSSVCIDRSDSCIYFFQRGERGLLPTPSLKWPSLEDWVTSEIARLSMLFDERGKRLVNESQTLPHRVA